MSVLGPVCSMSANDSVVKQVARRLEGLQRQGMERYQVREDKVISAVTFCVGALEQLQEWAMFAIFPQDERQSHDQYIAFVEYKYQCILGPLKDQTSYHWIIQSCRLVSDLGVTVGLWGRWGIQEQKMAQMLW